MCVSVYRRVYYSPLTINLAKKSNQPYLIVYLGMPGRRSAKGPPRSVIVPPPKRKTISMPREQLRDLARTKALRVNTRRIDRGTSSLSSKWKQKLLECVDPEQFKCGICFELMLMPFSLCCGHIFCYGCLDDLSQHDRVNNHCPCCRAAIDDDYPKSCDLMDQLLKELAVRRLSQEQQDDYQGRN